MIIDTSALTTTACSLSMCDSKEDTISSLVTTLSTYLTMGPRYVEVRNYHMAQSYVDSLSDQQLASLIEKVENKEQNIQTNIVKTKVLKQS
ncbi:MAG: hypothetical protein IJ193_01335 [Bacilli bacterium]|nr:hypothetical protein [Bacilli bacterium]